MKWEYYSFVRNCEMTGHNLHRDLNELGSLDWELTHVIPSLKGWRRRPVAIVYYFKRPKQETQE